MDGFPGSTCSGLIIQIQVWALRSSGKFRKDAADVPSRKAWMNALKLHPLFGPAHDRSEGTPDAVS